MTLVAGGVWSRTLALAGFSVLNLSLRAFFRDAEAATEVWTVLESMVAFRWVFWTHALACVVIVDLSFKAVGTRVGALALADVLVEVLSMRTGFDDTVTAA